MEVVAKILIAIVALEHLYILWMEMFAWETKGKEVFKAALPAEMFKPTKGLAANQGYTMAFCLPDSSGLFLLKIHNGRIM